MSRGIFFLYFSWNHTLWLIFHVKNKSTMINFPTVFDIENCGAGKKTLSIKSNKGNFNTRDEIWVKFCGKTFSGKFMIKFQSIFYWKSFYFFLVVWWFFICFPFPSFQLKVFSSCTAGAFIIHSDIKIAIVVCPWIKKEVF